ncbi:Helix-turn-helix domain-containing protein [Lentzea xinjiangensis]|uniref:Helix-turn-helix domain-containing protein n=1 Tax=Lentzea xinjiangensis TaxID=402600 RepID=A0A1H9T3B0_9PSEU|nr:helix-turn-helix transcriptional regulator [Lentzea xinjiangensis]SER91720.1 Helix-turn-helix domain-containing protein [Lentzea xinjiangensis]
MSETFGELLRAHRVAAGLSMGQLAKLIHYSKGYLSKIENDLKPPTPTVARLCDGVLDVGGRLVEAALLNGSLRNEPPRNEPPRNGPLSNGQGLGRRRVLVAGTMLGVGALTGGGQRPVPDEQVIAGMRTSFEELRGLGLRTSPRVVLEPLKALQQAVHGMAREDTGPVGVRLLRLAGRIAEYTGWMCQEAGDEQGALWWTRHASELSRAAGDPDIASYAFVREAGLALYRQDAAATISLAQQAQWIGRAGSRVLALAARREAQGHALAGDRSAAGRAFDLAAQRMESVPADSPYPALGPSAPDPLELARGWALSDLGRNAEAAALLERQLALVPVTSRRSRARFGTRRSLAHALSGEVDESCRTLAEVLDDAAHVDSATVRTGLRQLARTLGRWHNHGAVREIYPELKRLLAHR